MDVGLLEILSITAQFSYLSESNDVAKYLFSSLQKVLTYKMLSDNIDGYMCTLHVGQLDRGDCRKKDL